MGKKALVGIIMGSDSDLPKIAPAFEILEKFNIPFEVDIVSAHRTPEKMAEYAKTAEKRNIEVIIAIAGGSAHLPGMTASHTVLPVIGVPAETNDMGGIDSLHSIVQMPNGVPVATVGINRAQNAGILAAEILGVKYPEVREKVRAYKEELEKMVETKSQELIKRGPASYLKEKNR